MKILMVNKFLYPRGGCETYMLNLAEELKAQGHEVEYFGMYDEKNTVGNSAGLYTTNMDFHSKGLSRFLYPFKIIYSREAKRKIGKVLDDFKPDIVHLNNINFQLTPSVIYAVKKRNIPLVQTVHDYQMICPNHLLYSFNETKPCERCISGSKLNCFKHSCIHGSKIKSLIGAIEAKLYSILKTYKKVDLYVCPSKFLENKLLSASDIYKDKTFTIHNFIEKKPIPEKSVVVSFDDGFLSVQKNAAPIMKKYGIKSNVYLPTAYIGKDSHFMDWEMIKSLQDSGEVEMQAHTHNHVDIRTLSLSAMQEEIQNSKAIFDKELGFNPCAICLPFGTCLWVSA